AAVVLEPVALAIALVVDGDEDAAVQKGKLAQPLGERVEAVLRRFEDLRIGPEGDLRTTLLRSARDLQRTCRHAALVALLIDLTVAPDLEIQPLGERVDHRHADA